MSLILALTLILSFGSLAAQAAATEATNVTTVAPVNYAVSGTTVRQMGSEIKATILVDDDNATMDADGYVSVMSIKSSSRDSKNTWFIVKLPEVQKVSAIVIDQWKKRIAKYKVFATSNTTLGDKIYGNHGSTEGLSADIISSLNNEGALVASGTLATDHNTVATNGKDTIVFDSEKNAKYIVFLIESTSNDYNGLMLDYIEVLGNSAKNKTEFAQFPEISINYADKSVYSDVSAIITNTIDEKANGKSDTLVNPNSTAISTSFNLPLTVIPSLQKSGTTLNNNTWFGIDLGTERTFDTVNIYQYKNRMKTVSVYSATAEQFANAAKDDKELDQAIIDGLTLLKKNVNLSTAGGTSDKTLNNSKTELTTPSTVNLGDEKQARYLIFLVTDCFDKYKGMPVFEVHVLGSEPSIQQTNAYPTGGLDYTVNFVNRNNDTKRYALIEAQYNEAGVMIASNINYVNIDPLYAKSFAGKIEKVDGAKTIKVFSWCLDELKPLETEYTFNVQ